MTAVIFAGPSVRGLDLPSRNDVLFRPPAKQGDIFRATLTRPEAIGLIDGYFDGVPSVWHKEILWAMSQGIRVFGSASMGALRAAELEQRLGISRTTLNTATRELLDEGTITCAGQGRALRYSLVT